MLVDLSMVEQRAEGDRGSCCRVRLPHNHRRMDDPRRILPGATKMKVKMTVEARSGRLLGAQIIGREGAAKRIDVLATAPWNEMTVDDLHQVDLSYAPPFSPVWDPVLIAARKAWEMVEESLPERR